MTGARLLVVEDDESLGIVLVDALESEGYFTNDWTSVTGGSPGAFAADR